MRKLLPVCALAAMLSGCNAVPSAPATSAAPAPSAAPTPAPKPEDRWSVDVVTNELDGKKKITLSDREVVVRCGSRIEGYINPDLPGLGHTLDVDAEDRAQAVRFRLDNGPLRRERWSVSTSFDALFLPTKTLRQMIGSKKLVLEYKPEYTTSTTQTFDLTGLKEAFAKAGCK